jgi:FkbH-like protein
MTSNFNEEWYLAQYPDVRESIRLGAFRSGREHYDRCGQAEGRQSNGPSDRLKEALKAEFPRHNASRYLCPEILQSSSELPRRILFVGACMLEAMNYHRKNPENIPGEFILSNQASEQAELPRPLSNYDLQLSQIPLRTVMPELGLWRLSYEDIAGYEQFLEECKDRLRKFVHAHLINNRRSGLLTFFMNFFVPQQNPMGRLLPRYDIRNPCYFVARLNEELELTLSNHPNTYVLDCDLIAASMGRRHVQEDAVQHFSHGGMGPDFGAIPSRIEPSPAAAQYFSLQIPEAERAIWNEIIAMYRTVRQIDSVKMVVVDLDDTLWNGVAAEMDYAGPEIAEGWPLGMVEALVYLKKRGVLLGLLSRNDEHRVADIWNRVFGERFSLQWFAVKIINWRSKTENMRDLLGRVNLLPRSIVYVDDHPSERAAMKEAFRDIRVLDGLHYYWRKTLLWSPETQVASLSIESMHRTEMIQAQTARDQARSSLSEDDFLVSQKLQIQIERIGPEHGLRQRALELLNKTNQFNTTGRRWTTEDFLGFLGSSGRAYVISATDRFTPYGVIAVAMIEGPVIRQFVMSCRAFGRQIEIAALTRIIEEIKEFGEVSADTQDTDANLPSRDLYQRIGFEWQDKWVLCGAAIPPPDHIACTIISGDRSPGAMP